MSVALRIAAGAAITEPDVEHAVRSEHESATVVVRVRLPRLRESRGAPSPLSAPMRVGRDEPLRNARPHLAALGVVVDVEEPVVAKLRRERETEQAELASGRAPRPRASAASLSPPRAAARQDAAAWRRARCPFSGARPRDAALPGRTGCPSPARSRARRVSKSTRPGRSCAKAHGVPVRSRRAPRTPRRRTDQPNEGERANEPKRETNPVRSPHATKASIAPMRIDAHQHYWKIERGDYDWMSAPAARPIRRDFYPASSRPSSNEHHIDRTVACRLRQPSPKRTSCST